MARLNALLIGPPAVEDVEGLAVRVVDARPGEGGCSGDHPGRVSGTHRKRGVENDEGKHI